MSLFLWKSNWQSILSHLQVTPGCKWKMALIMQHQMVTGHHQLNQQLLASTPVCTRYYTLTDRLWSLRVQLFIILPCLWFGSQHESDVVEVIGLLCDRQRRNVQDFPREHTVRRVWCMCMIDWVWLMVINDYYIYWNIYNYLAALLQIKKDQFRDNIIY